ncbi:hypothetical protein ATO6_14255 [Oceanicola sp. 22II-s10i]|uniref:siderophore-interacting protein n=1 Tax=Oceanicola sp. 22II-s10i TaxID=1317116 RepID=UPI000B526D9F|nr:siderophore-interacting protein [Oceanicola sp. 22II-s10i]OWU84206.1 hypothetical protein ATO6_14255 [Oceanicola sp. 22II-s10i]
MSFTAQATALCPGPLPDDVLPHLAAHARAAELEVSENGTDLQVRLLAAQVDCGLSGGDLSVRIGAVDAIALQQIREFVLHLLDHVAPGAGDRATWQGDIRRDAPPLNFCTATVRSVRRVAPHFLRVEMDCDDTRRLAEGRGMHFSLLLPPEDRAPVWPRLDGTGRTVWPQGDDALHRAVYTFVEFDIEAGRFTFDVFEHDGGRATGWARGAQPGDLVGITGPGSGRFPPGDRLLIAGDETALPAIRRILARSEPDRTGQAFIEVGGPEDICDMPRPDGIALTWVLRDRGEALWDHLSDLTPPEGDGRYVWVAAEKDLVRRAKARFRGDFGIGQDEGYFAFYWTA